MGAIRFKYQNRYFENYGNRVTDVNTDPVGLCIEGRSMGNIVNVVCFYFIFYQVASNFDSFKILNENLTHLRCILFLGSTHFQFLGRLIDYRKKGQNKWKD